MNLIKEKNSKEINIIIKKGRKNQNENIKIEKKEEKIKQNNKIKKDTKPKYKKSRFQKLVFPISQITGKIKFNKNKKYNLPNISSEDIIFILKLISKESHNFSPVKSKFKNNLLFTILCTLSLGLGIYFFDKKKFYF